MNAREFLSELYQGVPTDKMTYAFSLPGKKCYPYALRHLDGLVEKAMELSDTENAYFGLHLMDKPPASGKRASLNEISCVSFLHGEYDIKGPAHKENDLPETLEETLAFLHALECPPSIIVFSGNGVHTYWLLEEPIAVNNDNRSRIQRIMKGYEQSIHQLGREKGWNFDPVADLARILRVPDTLNHKSHPP